MPSLIQQLTLHTLKELIAAHYRFAKKSHLNKLKEFKKNIEDNIFSDLQIKAEIDIVKKEIYESGWLNIPGLGTKKFTKPLHDLSITINWAEQADSLDNDPVRLLAQKLCAETQQHTFFMRKETKRALKSFQEKSFSKLPYPSDLLIQSARFQVLFLEDKNKQSFFSGKIAPDFIKRLKNFIQQAVYITKHRRKKIVSTPIHSSTIVHQDTQSFVNQQLLLKQQQLSEQLKQLEHLNERYNELEDSLTNFFKKHVSYGDKLLATWLHRITRISNEGTDIDPTAFFEEYHNQLDQLNLLHPTENLAAQLAEYKSITSNKDFAIYFNNKAINRDKETIKYRFEIQKEKDLQALEKEDKPQRAAKHLVDSTPFSKLGDEAIKYNNPSLSLN